MPYRWVVCPVVVHVDIDVDTGLPSSTDRRPKIAEIIDPGRGKYYMHASAIDVGNWCLCLVSGIDFAPLDADSEVFDLFQIGGYRMSNDIMGKTLRQLGLNAPRVNRIRNIMIDRGIDTSNLTIDSTVEQWLTRICTSVSQRFLPKRLFCIEV